MTKETNELVPISTKVSKTAAAALDAMAAKIGATRYEVLQMVVDTLTRYMDDRHNLTPEMERAMSLFEHLVGWKDALHLSDPTVEKEIQEATYYLTDPAGKRKGVRAVHVDRPFMGQWEQTENIQQIVERTLCLTTPERYRRLRRLAVSMDCHSLLELIDVMIDHHTSEEDFKEMRAAFEDDDRSEYGRKPVSQPYRRKPKRDIEKEPGFRPFGIEW